MNNTHHLFELIKSMTSSEKRFFKLSTQKHTKEDDLIYIKLFDVIEKQSQYDEQAIINTFSGEPFIKRIAAEKHNLYHILLNSLNEFNNENSVNQKLYTLLKNVRILHDKLLFKQALKLIKSAKEKALKFNKQFILLELIDIEIACINSLMNFDLLSDKLPSLQAEIEESIRKIDKTASFIKYYSSFINESKKYFNVRSKDQADRLDEIFGNLLKENSNIPLNGDDYFRYQSLLSYFYMSKRQYSDAIKITEELIKYIEKESDFIKVYPERLLNTLYSYMMLCDLNKHYPEALECYNKAINHEENYKIKETPLINFIKLRFYVYRLNQTIRHTEFETGFKIIDQLEKRSLVFKGILSNEQTISFNYNAAYLCFLKEDFKKSLKHINNIINLPEGESRMDIRCFARIMNLIIHYELQNFDTLSYTLRNTHYYLNKNNVFFKTESLVVKLFTKLTRPNPNTLSQFIDFKEKLSIIFTDPAEAETSEYFDMLSWAESKVTQDSFISIVKKKNLQQ